MDSEGDTTMITVHHLNNSRSQRVLWLLEELGVEYQIVPHVRDPATMRAPAQVRGVHPLGKLPVIIDGDLTLAESGAIVEYLVERHGGGRLAPPPDSPARLRYLYWMHYAEGSIMPPLLLRLVFDQIETGPMPFLIRPIVRGLSHAVKDKFIGPEIERNLDFCEAELSRTTWFAGDEITAADVMMSFPMQVAAAKGGLGRRRPRLAAWLTSIEARPAYLRAIERGGPYSLTGF
jgi:glutathione S-transferase